MSFSNYYELIVFVLLLPLSITIYRLLLWYEPSNLHSAIILPILVFLVVGITFCISTPRQDWTAAAYALQLACIIVWAVVQEYPIPCARISHGCSFMEVDCLIAPFYMAGMLIGSYVVSLFAVFLLLSIKGVEREQMGYVGKIGDRIVRGIGVTLKIIEVVLMAIAVVITDVDIILADGLRGGLRGLRGHPVPDTEASNQAVPGAEASNQAVPGAEVSGAQACPPPYYVSRHVFPKQFHQESAQSLK